MSKIVYLYTRLNGFVLATLRELVRTDACETIDVVHWTDPSRGNHFVIPEVPGVRFHDRSTLDDEGILRLLEASNPGIIYVSGWMDQGYVRALRRFRTGSRAVTVCGVDDQWRGTWRQRLGSLYFRLAYRRLFDRMWVAGKPQYYYARRFGYGPGQIVGNLLSADAARFSPAAQIVRRFVFVGRFDRVKGLDTLIAAYRRLPSEVRTAWPLVMIGDGELRSMVEAARDAGVVVLPYLQPDDLAVQLAQGGVGMLTSTFEQWGVSLHEMALTGYPLIASTECGAASEFLVHGHNGFGFKAGDVDGLATAMLSMARLPEGELARMGRASVELGRRISPEISARSLLSVAPVSELDQG